MNASDSMALGGTGVDAVNVGIGTTVPSATLHVNPATAATLQIDPFGAAVGDTRELRLVELSANGTNHVGFKAPDGIGPDRINYPYKEGIGTVSPDGSAAVDITSKLRPPSRTLNSFCCQTRPPSR